MKKSRQKQSISKLIAKVLLRVFLIILALSAVPLLNNKNNNQLDQMHLQFANSYAFIFPILLFVIFVVLLIVMLKHKYNKIDINWLFSLNAAFLIIYLLLLYSRILPQLIAS